MHTEASPPNPPSPVHKKPCVKIFGVGKAGVLILEQLRLSGLPEVHSVAVDADEASLAASGAIGKIELEKKLLARLGEVSRETLDLQMGAVKSACDGAQAVIIVAGLGGRTGTQLAVAVAKAARESGAQVYVFVTLPFDCEGRVHQAAARQGLEQLSELTDTVFCLSHQDTFALIEDTTHLEDAFQVSAEFIVNGVAHACRALTGTEVVGLGFADLCLLIRQKGIECAFAVAEASGPNRVRELVEKLMRQPSLQGGAMMAKAETVIVSVVSGSRVRIGEVDHVMQQLAQHARGVPHLLGVGNNACLGDRLSVMVVVTQAASAAEHGEPGGKSISSTGPAAADRVSELDPQLLEKQTTARPASRFVPPAPALTPEQREQLLAKQGGGRLRKYSPRLRQGNLPLEIVSKGRFDKTEPTVHKGEDLDLPTYIRRGVALN